LTGRGEALPDGEELRVKLWDNDDVGLVDSVRAQECHLRSENQTHYE